ncbi:MAG: trypsin-like peptidase domain-containing protein [Chloroflexi bacterium]|nr:trypsin-like peptidase domain-containing protein [Chloroflexota bacterium]
MLTSAEVLELLRPSVVRVSVEVAPLIKLVGTGVVIDEEGYLLTSYQLVKDAESVEVTLPTGETLTGEVIGRDRVTGVAVVRVEAHGLVPAPFSDPAVAVGDTVVSVGYDFEGDEPLTSEGVVTLTDGSYVAHLQIIIVDIIESEAVVSLGGRGGPLVSSRGEVVGINLANAVVPRVGVAVEIDVAREVAAQMIEFGYVQRSFLGVVPLNNGPSLANILNLATTTGMVVVDVLPDTGAEEAGLADDDVIVQMNDDPIANTGDLARFLMRHPPGEAVLVTYYRGEEKLTVELVLGERPERFR